MDTKLNEQRNRFLEMLADLFLSDDIEKIRRLIHKFTRELKS